MRSESAHCLRAEFTNSLATRLLAGESLTLISPHGQGRRRTLLDLHESLPENSFIIQVNMRSYSADYKGFIESIIQLSECQDADDVNNLNSLLNQLEKEHRRVVIILHNFDEIRNNEAISGGYNAALFSALNSIRVRDNISLLSVCEQPFDNYLLQRDGNELPGSKLNHATVRLPELTREQLLTELRHREFDLTDHELRSLAEWLRNQPAPYTMLEQCTPDWVKQKLWQQQ